MVFPSLTRYTSAAAGDSNLNLNNLAPSSLAPDSSTPYNPSSEPGGKQKPNLLNDNVDLLLHCQNINFIFPFCRYYR